MKRAENILTEYYTFVDNLNHITVEENNKDLLTVIRIAQEDAIRETVKECADAASLECFEFKEDWMDEPINITIDDYGNIYGIDKNSILSVADKLIKEL